MYILYFMDKIRKKCKLYFYQKAKTLSNDSEYRALLLFL